MRVVYINKAGGLNLVIPVDPNMDLHAIAYLSIRQEFTEGLHPYKFVADGFDYDSHSMSTYSLVEPDGVVDLGSKLIEEG